MADEEVTLAIILEHIQSMRTALESRMDRLENRMDRLEINLTRQIVGIDERLDVIEIEYLPKRVAWLEAKAGK